MRSHGGRLLQPSLDHLPQDDQGARDPVALRSGELTSPEAQCTNQPQRSNAGRACSRTSRNCNPAE
eukprot:9538720-Alexandrium_andersonii.AAC.1